MAGHTPGPWRAEHQPLGSAVYVDGGKTLATAHGSAAITGEKWPHVANARLIAAAPDMLEALRKLAAEVGGLRAFESELRAEISNTNWNVLMLRLSEADTAIAKAEGTDVPV